MTTTDIAGLCERLAILHEWQDSPRDRETITLSKTTLERQAAEIERLRGVVSLVSDIFTDMIRNGYVYSGEEPAPFGAYYIGPGALETIFSRAALTGEDT